MERNTGATTGDVDDKEDIGDADSPQNSSNTEGDEMDLSADLTDALSDTYISDDDGEVAGG